MSAPAHEGVRLGPLREAMERRYARYLADLRELTAIDSGSDDAEGVDRAGAFAAGRLRALGFEVRLVPVAGPGAEPLGAAVVARRRGELPHGRRVLLLAHLDTVYGRGTAAARPLRIEDGIAYAPGVCDDKGGLLLGLAAAGALADAGMEQYGELVVLLTPDEEIGSPGSRPLTESLAAEADYAFCLEGARENGDVVIARKGAVDLRITLRGKAAHSGIEPERGANAALAAAHLVVALQQLKGVNVGRVRAGTRTNIVCDEAVLDVEVRAVSRAELDAVLREIDALAAHTWVPGTSAEVVHGEICPPMEHTAPAAVLAAAAVGIAAELGFTLGVTETGGVADANYAAGTGVPVLDGLGPVGGGDHSPGEWLDLASVVPRGTLLAALIARFGAGSPA
ncbi:M20/M25/M40 family metallo-hydrolase [Streptomyces indicus]|uniref:Glutamate carboxypeptidase n=1 Tax=Streptomyces indicus TaxID=417292 RepID=A0A1G8UXV1_9ACTN|nr:M20/M25/M40 family metallo-hydrolase [Streptomyces indicus]SDJ58641.1 glutamate carboxypeptidase [Streptomyces indicus]